jgi:nicotinamide mononucleotide transporter
LDVTELSAVILGFAYLILISFSQRIAWIFGILSSAIYVYMAFIGAIYLQAGLQFVYVVLGIFGFINWGKSVETKLKIWSLQKHLLVGIPTLLLALTLGFVFSKTSQKLPYLDAFISAFAILATYLTTKSILENWLYWIVLNLLSMYLWYEQDFDFKYTVFLFAVNTLMAVFGFILWRKKWLSEQAN